MFKDNIFPVIRPIQSVEKQDKKPALSKGFNIKSLGLGFFQGSWLGLRNVKGGEFEKAPYDLDQIIQAVDTDSYAKQAFLKYKDLFWKEGWDIIGENPEAVSYLYQRIDLLEEAMGQTFQDFMVGCVDTLIKFHNVFVVRSYGEIDPRFRVAGESNKSLVGFYTIPIETVRVLRDKNNRPLKYQQEIVDGLDMAFNNDLSKPSWNADEVIHLYLDRKDGHFFGTPAIVSAIDDIKALRQIEQDILNLIHRDLFPLYLYKVGTDERPSTPEELNDAATELANLRVEGGLVLPERHDVEVIGAENNALKAESYLAHFKERVAIGLGVFPHHLGMTGSGANRSMTDRLDMALYDRIKFIQSYVENIVRLHIFNGILREGGFHPVQTPFDDNTISDRCYLKFREIDIDTQIKKENHYLNLFNGDAIDWNELRAVIGRSEDVDPALLKSVITHLLQVSAQIEVLKASPTPASATSKGSTPAPKKPDAIPSSTGVMPNLPNFKKDTGNKVAPANQHGRRFSPNVRRSDDILSINESLLSEVVNLLDTEQLGE